MLELKQVSKTFFPGSVNERKALVDINLFVKKGDFISIIGGNGAGKSTLFNIISGGFLADAGNLILDEKNITFMPRHKRAALIGQLFQDPMKGTAPNMTIEENLAMAYMRGSGSKSVFGLKKATVSLFRDRLAALDMGLEDRMKTKVGLLSGGQRQAVTLMMATIITPKLLLLDEHTAALDPATADKVSKLTKSIVEQHQITTLMITHNMQYSLESGNRTLMMDNGHIILDIQGEDRKNLTVPDLLELFKAKSNKALDNDRMLLS